MGGVIHPLHQVDLLTPAERKITEKEYWAQRRGQEKLDELNQKMKEDGITPKETRYQTEKQFLRDAIDDAASTAQSPEEFSKILDEKYHIIFKISRNRYSYLHPGRKKYITERNLGTRYTEDFLLKAFEENTKSHREQKEEILEQQSPNTSTDLPTVPFSDTSAISTPFIFIKSDLRLVIDLQTCIKAQQSGAYAQKVKLTNLKQMAQTVAYIQEHGYDSLDDFHVELNGKDSSTNIVSRSVAKGESHQVFLAKISGNNKCAGHSECDAIIMENAHVDATPELSANNIDASLIHEAAIGKIAGDQLIKLMTLGLTEAEAEEQIINGFLK
mgnify:CR=1 FL=1